MKKELLRFVLTSCLALMATTGVTAQGKNAVQNVSVMELTYMMKEGVKSDVAMVVGAVLDVLADQTTTEEPGYTDALRSSVIMALGNVRRFAVTDGLQVAPNDGTEVDFDDFKLNIQITKN